MPDDQPSRSPNVIASCEEHKVQIADTATPEAVAMFWKLHTGCGRPSGSAHVPPPGTLCFDGDGKPAVGYGCVSGVPLCADACESEGGMQGFGCVCKGADRQ